MLYFADENLFDVFTVKVLKGNPKNGFVGSFFGNAHRRNSKKIFW